jgi:hypothetical protein
VKNAEEKEGEEGGKEGSNGTRSIEACFKFVFFLFSIKLPLMCYKGSFKKERCKKARDHH